MAGRQFNLIALASLLVAIAPINGPLLQRASSPVNGTVALSQELRLPVTQLIQQRFTGIISGRTDQVNMLTTDFAGIARDYYNRAPLILQSDCAGSCMADVLGAGLHTNCSSYRQPYKISTTDASATSVEVFGIEVVYNVPNNPTSVNLNVVYKPDAGCTGELIVTNCSLRAGTVQYSVLIDSLVSTISLAPGTTIWDDVMVGNPDYLSHESHLTGTTTYGGIYLSLANQFNTKLLFKFAGAVGFELAGTQSEASISYARNITGQVTCGLTFIDPLPNFLQSTRELMFRTAVSSANDSNVQVVQAQASGTHFTYRTEFLFLALGNLFSMLAFCAVLVVFDGFWDLGRVVSMSPIETAKAFNAPMLRHGDSNAPAGDLLKQVGSQPVKYGVVHDANAEDELSISAETTSECDSLDADAPGNTSSPIITRRHSARLGHSANDLELAALGKGSATTSAHLELADPARVTGLRRTRS